MEQTAFDRTVEALRQKGLNSDEILEELSSLFRELVNCENIVAKKVNMIEGKDEKEREERYALKIKNLLSELRIPYGVRGYHVITEAIKLYTQSGGRMGRKEMYEELAKIFDCSFHAIEKGIRYAIGRSMEQCQITVYEEKFGDIVHNEKFYSNFEFIVNCVRVLNE